MSVRVLIVLLGVVAMAGKPCLAAPPLEDPASLRLGARYLHWTGEASRPVPQPVVPEPAPAQPVITLHDLERIAECNNPTLAQAAARIEAARAEWLQVGLKPNPRVGYVATEIGDEGQAGQQGAFVGQELITAQKLQRNRDIASQAIQQAEHAWCAQRQRVINDVRRAYYEVLVAQRTAELSDRLVQIGQEGVRAAEQLLKAQEVSRVDLLQARIEADTARITAEKARNRFLAAWRNLAVIAGVPDMPPASLTGDLQDNLARLSWEEAVQKLVCENPVLAEARAGVARAEATLARECAARVPNVDLEASLQYDNATRDTIAGVQVGVPLPMFNRNQGNIRRAEAELAVARNEVQRVSLELQQRLAGSFEQYMNACTQVEKYANQILPNAQASLDLVVAGYRQGEFSYLTLLTAQRTFFQVNLSYLDALRDLRTASIEIEGNLLRDSLQQR